MIFRPLSLFGMVAFAPQGDCAISSPIRVALYGDKGAILDDEKFPYQKTLEQAAGALGEGSVTVLKSDGIKQNLTNEAFDVVFFPGGWGSGQIESLGHDGMTVVKAFVSNGGGFIGTCAGAFLAMKGLFLYGEGPSGKGPDVQSLGGGTVPMEFADQSYQDFGLDRQAWAGNVTIFYGGGPVVAPNYSFPSNVSILATYSGAVPSWDPTPQGVGTPAITSSHYGRGRVVLNSPHAEHTESASGLGVALYKGELAWVSGRQTQIQTYLV